MQKHSRSRPEWLKFLLEQRELISSLQRNGHESGLCDREDEISQGCLQEWVGLVRHLLKKRVGLLRCFRGSKQDW